VVGPGHQERQIVQTGEGDRGSRIVFHSEGHSRFLTGQPALYLQNLEDQTLEAGRIHGNHVCSLNRSIELQLALWDVASCALVIADLRPSGMFGASGEIYIIVA